MPDPTPTRTQVRRNFIGQTGVLTYYMRFGAKGNSFLNIFSVFLVPKLPLFFIFRKPIRSDNIAGTAGLLISSRTFAPGFVR